LTDFSPLTFIMHMLRAAFLLFHLKSLFSMLAVSILLRSLIFGGL